LWETLVLCLVAFMLFRPGFFWDKIFPPYIDKPGTEIVQIVEDMDSGAMLRMKIKGEKMDGTEFTKAVMFPVGEAKTGAERLNEIGFETRVEEGKVLVDNVVFSSNAEKMGIDFDQEILEVKMPAKRLPKQIVFFPAIAIFAVIYVIQKKRRDRLELATA